MRALVIGGNGFIGSHLIERLRAAGHAVAVLDPGAARDDLDWSGVDYLRAPYTDPDALDAALVGCDTVFHLASTTVPSTSNADPRYDVSSNLLGALALIDGMRRRGVRRIVFFSSGGTVYGNPDYVPIDERHPLRPISSYGIVKVAIEHYLLMYRHLGELEPLILRASNPYGPRQSSSGGQGFIAAALARVEQGLPVQIWGDGEVVRDFLYIADLADGAVHAAERGAIGVYNLGSGRGDSLNAVCATIDAATGRRVAVEHLPGRGFDVRRVVLDTRAAQADFGWSAQTPLEQGIAATWAARAAALG
jgi:UDP-glucose 4-epimerase